MNINTGKLTPNSSQLIKETKKKDLAAKSSKITNLKEDKISSKLLKDFPEILTNNKSYKTRLVNLNNKLTEYESELSKNQFVEEKLKAIEDYFQKKENNKISDLIDTSIYKGEKILKNYFTQNKNFEMQIENAKKEVEKNFIELENQYKTIEITSQNIISQYSYPMNIGENTIKNLNLDELVKSTEINNKRVMDLIS